jgi:hypothetical protein
MINCLMQQKKQLRKEIHEKLCLTNFSGWLIANADFAPYLRTSPINLYRCTQFKAADK